MSAKPKEVLDRTEKDEYLRKLDNITRHIKNVQEKGHLLAERLIEEGEQELARKLIQRCYRHDNSKFSGIEWDHLWDKNDELFKTALLQHHNNNSHHPEYFGENGIGKMRDEELAEFACDICSRGSEMGTDIRLFIKENAAEKYGFSLQSKAYKKVKKFIDMILIKSF